MASQNDNKKRKLIILGEQSPEIFEYLSNLQLENEIFTIEIQNNRFTDDYLTNKILDSEVILAIYKEHFGSSGMIINAVFYNKKTLFIPIGVLNSFAIELEINSLPTSYNIDELHKAIENIDKTQQQYNFLNRKLFLANRNKKSFSNQLLS